MWSENQVTVLKFGSSVLRCEDDLQTAVHEIYRWWREGRQVVAVVSAFGDTTDELTRRARNVCEAPDEASLATLLATGEAASSALLGLTLNKVGIPAQVLDAVQVGLRTSGSSLDADPIAIDVTRLQEELRSGVVVLPGFVGRRENGDPTLLGRGGSDLTALFLASRLRASCVLVKDVDGLYTSDPACPIGRASRFTHVSYETAARVGGPVVQLKAVRFAEEHRLRFSITSIGADRSTKVGPFADRLAGPETAAKPLRVALLGCGTVGGGVYERLSALPELFTVIGVGSRNAGGARESGVRENLITSDLNALIEKQVDVVVELIGGTQLASSLVEHALNLGRHVVTANKALLAGNEVLESSAVRYGASLRYSAAVGGVMPALETIKRARADGPLRSFSGVLNGTSNFVLDRVAAGATIGDAVKDAQAQGFAEANTQLDLDGTDAAQKLVLLARSAFGFNLPLESVRRKGIEDLDAKTLRRVELRGRRVRLVAECRRFGNRLEASVGPVELRLDHALAQVRGVNNGLLVEPEVGTAWTVSGRGAGRWPTAEAVLGDLLDLKRELQMTETNEVLEECVA